MVVGYENTIEWNGLDETVLTVVTNGCVGAVSITLGTEVNNPPRL